MATPSDTAGEDTRNESCPPIPCHNGWHTAAPQPSASNTFSRPSFDVNDAWESTKTTPFHTAGAAMACGPVWPIHDGWQVGAPQPSAGNTARPASPPAMYA